MVNESTQSPAAIARARADHGSPLTHPDLLDADVRWRSERMFVAEEVNFDTPAAAVTWMEELCRRPNRDQFRQAVLNLKRELELIVDSQRTRPEDRLLAREIGQWLSVWLQNPPIFKDWFELRRKTEEFLQLFGS